MDLVHTIYEPPGDGPHPTLLVLHGWGANALDLLGLAPHLAAGRFLVLCPQGPVQTPLGPGMVGYGWYPLIPGTPPEPQELWTARGRILNFLDAAADRYPIDAKKLAVVGFQPRGRDGLHPGARRTGAFRRPRRPPATWCPPDAVDNVADPDTLRYLPTLIQHGSRDELVTVDRARESVETLRALHPSPHLPRIRHRPRNQPPQPGGPSPTGCATTSSRPSLRCNLEDVGRISAA